MSYLKVIIRAGTTLLCLVCVWLLSGCGDRTESADPAAASALTAAATVAPSVAPAMVATVPTFTPTSRIEATMPPRAPQADVWQPRLQQPSICPRRRLRRCLLGQCLLTVATGAVSTETLVAPTATLPAAEQLAHGQALHRYGDYAAAAQ